MGEQISRGGCFILSPTCRETSIQQTSVECAGRDQPVDPVHRELTTSAAVRTHSNKRRAIGNDSSSRVQMEMMQGDSIDGVTVTLSAGRWWS